MKVRCGQKGTALFVITLAFFFSGCGEKTAVVAPLPETAPSTEAEVLPVLSQNEIPVLPAIVKPDDSLDLSQIEDTVSPEDTKATSLSD